MANFSAADVKRLRDQTGAGMMDCKNALTEAEGDFDRAIEFLRIKGPAKSPKRAAARAPSTGLVGAHVENGLGRLVQIRSETACLAKCVPFTQLADRVL